MGEITQAMESVYGRHVANDRLVSGAYRTEYGETEEITAVANAIENFQEVEGRRPRILVSFLQLVCRPTVELLYFASIWK